MTRLLSAFGLVLLVLLGMGCGAAERDRLANPAGHGADLPESLEDIEVEGLAPFLPPRPERSFLANGMTVLLQQDALLPLVHGVLRLQTGSLDDPPDAVGTTEILARTIRSGGHAALSGNALENELAQRGITLEVEVGRRLVEFQFELHRDDLSFLLATLGEMIQRPALPAGLLRLESSQALAALNYLVDDATAHADREAVRALYGSGHAWARVPDSTSLAGLQRESLLLHHRAFFGSRGAVLALAGDLDTELALPQAEQAFGDWALQRSDSRAASSATPASGQGSTFLAHRPGASQAEIRLLLPGVRRDHPDFPALSLASFLLGSGGFGSRAMTRLRSELGLVYWVDAGWQPAFDDQGLFLATTATAPENAGVALAELLALVEELGSVEAGREEFENARRRLLHSQVFEVDTTVERLRRSLNLIAHQYPSNYHAVLERAWRTLQPADVLRAVQRHLQPSRLTVFIQGDRTRLQLDPDLVERALPWPPSETVAAGPVVPFLRKFQQGMTGWVPDPLPSAEQLIHYLNSANPPLRPVQAARATAALSSAALGSAAPGPPYSAEVSERWRERILQAHGGARPWRQLSRLGAAWNGGPPGQELRMEASCVALQPMILSWPSVPGARLEAGSEQAWFSHQGDRQELDAQARAGWTFLRHAFLPALLLDLAAGGGELRPDQGGRVLFDVSGGRQLTLVVDSQARIVQVHGAEFRLRYLGYHQQEGVWLPAEAEFQPEGGTPERWVFEPWQVQV